MRATAKNKLGKIEKNKKVKEGDCIFPFKYKYQEHNKCIETEKGEICATEVNPKSKTMIKYGYCPESSLKKGTKKKAPKKLKLVESYSKKPFSNGSISKKLKANTSSPKTQTLKKKPMSKKMKLKLVADLKPASETRLASFSWEGNFLMLSIKY